MAYKYIQITSERDLSSTNFENGVIEFKRDLGSNYQINLNKSFLRMKYKLSKADGTTQLELSDNISPNYLMANNLFRQCFHFMNGTEVDSIRQYVSQCGALQHRKDYPSSYKNKFLATTNFAKIDFNDRMKDIISEGFNENAHLAEDKYAALSLIETFNGSNLNTGADTLTLGANNGIFTWVDAALGDLNISNGALSVNDYVKVTVDGANNDLRITTIHRVSAIDALTLTVEPIPSFAGGGGAFADNAIFNIRKVPIIKDISRRAQQTQLVFKPPMGIWNNDEWLPAHLMQLQLYPHADGTYQKNVIQSIGANKIHNTNFNFQVNDLILYLAVKESKHTDGEMDMMFECVRAQIKNITTTANVDHHFKINPLSHAITVAFQDESAQNSTLFSESLFKIRNNEDLKLAKYWIEYNGWTLPNPYPDLSKSSSVDLFVQRYYETMYYSDSANLQDVESFDEWQSAGAYYTHKFKTNPQKRSEGVKVSTQFEENAFENNHNPNIIVWDHYYRTIKMKIHNGKVSDLNVSMMY